MRTASDTRRERQQAAARRAARTQAAVRRRRAARAGLFAWTLGFLLAPLVHLWAHRADHHHHGEAVRWVLPADHDDVGLEHGHGHEPLPALEPGHKPGHDHDLDHADGAGHLHAAVLTPPVILPLFEGRLPAHQSPTRRVEAPATLRIWRPQHPRAPPVA